MANINEASNAYVTALKQMQGNAAPQKAGDASDVSFGDILKTSAQSAIDLQHKSENTAAKALIGQADMTDVLQAVNDAEIALNTVLAIRDRVVQSYQDLMRTPI